MYTKFLATKMYNVKNSASAIALHASIIFFLEIGFGHSITRNNFFYTEKKNIFTLIFMHMESFADFLRK